MSNVYNVSVTNKLKIAEKTWEITYKVDDPDFFFCAGQYVWVITPKGRKAFSISSSSIDQKHIKIIFRENEKSEFKRYLINSDLDIKISDSRGLLRVSNYDRTVYIAGGAGIAPVMSILRTMKDKKIDKKVYLYFINKREESSFYLDELKSIKNECNWFDFKLIIADQVEFKKLNKESKYIVFGNQVFIDWVYKSLKENKIDDRDIIFEENYPSQVSKIDFGNQSNIYKIAIDNSTSHTVITDANGVIVYANKQAEVTTGYTFEEMKGQTPRLWGGLMSKEDYLNFWNTIKNDKKVYKGTFKNMRKSGQLYEVYAIVSPILDEKENVIGFIGNESDITQEKEKQEQAEKLNKLTTGRELKIIELKKIINELKNKTSND